MESSANNGDEDGHKLCPPSYHGHFGAGRLGLGLAIPALTCLSRPLALFQRSNSRSWTSLDRSQKLKLIVNDEVVTRFSHLHDGLSIAEATRLLDAGENVFVSCGRLDLIKTVLERTHSFSTAMGTGGYDEVLQCLSLIKQQQEQQRPYLIYLFENESNPTSVKFVETVRQLPKLFRVVPVTADRSCISLKAFPDHLEVKCESYPGIVILQDDCEFGIFKAYGGSPSAMPSSSRQEEPISTSFLPPEIVVTKTQAEQEFFTKRKLALVNGTQLLMAMWCYSNLMKQRMTPAVWDYYDLRSWAMSLIQEEHLRLLTLTRIWELLENTDKQVLFRIHDSVNMYKIAEITWNHFEVTLERMMKSYDPIGRILNIKDPIALMTKYKARFCCLKDFLFDKQLNSIPRVSLSMIARRHNSNSNKSISSYRGGVPKWILRLAPSYELNGVIAMIKGLNRDFISACSVANVETKPFVLNQLWSCNPSLVSTSTPSIMNVDAALTIHAIRAR